MSQFVPRIAIATALLAAALAVAATVSAAPPDGTFAVTPLVSDVAGEAPTTDANLVNTWGLARSATSPWWVVRQRDHQDNGLHRGGRLVSVGGNAPGRPRQPDRRRLLGDYGPVPGRHDSESDNARDVELHFRQRGRHNQRVARRLDRSARDGDLNAARCTRVWRSRTVPLGPRLYATDFHRRDSRVDVFDGGGTRRTRPARSSTQAPEHYAPFGIQTIGNRVFVTYAQQHADADDEIAGQGLGIVDAYDLDGNLLPGSPSTASSMRRGDSRRRRHRSGALRATSWSATSVTARSTPTRKRPAASQHRGTLRGDRRTEALYRRTVGARVRQRRIERNTRHALLHRRPG